MSETVLSGAMCEQQVPASSQMPASSKLIHCVHAQPASAVNYVVQACVLRQTRENYTVLLVALSMSVAGTDDTYYWVCIF